MVKPDVASVDRSAHYVKTSRMIMSFRVMAKDFLDDGVDYALFVSADYDECERFCWDYDGNHILYIQKFWRPR